MLRPVLAFLTLCGVVFLLAPTVASVHEGLESLPIHRELPWQIWKWGHLDPPPSVLPPICSPRHFDQSVNITHWPTRSTKGESFTIRGIDISPSEGNIGIAGVAVDVYLNDTKEEPGIHVGRAITQEGGTFTLSIDPPDEMAAEHYHIVARAERTPKGCGIIYVENWSDPEMDLTADTTLRFVLPDRVVIGHNVTVQGFLVDNVGAGVRDANLTLRIDGRPIALQTDASGAFRYTYLPKAGGVVKLNATYAGNDYYAGSTASDQLNVIPEDVRFEGPLELVRGEPRTFTGHVWLAPGTTPGPVTLTFRNVSIATCATCAPASTMTLQPDASGAFTTTLLVPGSSASGPFEIVASGGGLRSNVLLAGVVRVPVTIELEATGDALFKRTFHGTARALDDRGEAAPGMLRVETPSGWTNGTGVVAFAGSAACGTNRASANYDGNDAYVPATRAREFGVCGFFAALPSWLLAIPLWAWPLAVAALATLWLLARRAFERYAPTITRGPPLDVRFVEPDDGAGNVVGVGDAVVLEATLRAPLEAGQRLRIGTHRAMQDAALDGLSGRATIEATHLGEIPVRAEIVNDKGRVLTRRTASIHVVRYAEEIESRYRRLKREGHVDDAVSPREFEAWLRERDPHVDPRVARNLVGLFEEADYSPREAGRHEFLAFLRAEKGVRRDAV